MHGNRTKTIKWPRLLRDTFTVFISSGRTVTLRAAEAHTYNHNQLQHHPVGKKVAEQRAYRKATLEQFGHKHS